MKTLNIPFLLFGLTLSLVATGLVAVYSASASMPFLIRQLMFAGVGLAGMLFCYGIDYHLFKKASSCIMLLSLVLCCLVFVPGIGMEVKGACRWIGLGGFRVQPSEFARLGLVIYMAKMLSDRRPYMKSFFSGVLPPMLITGLFAVIIVLEPDFGAAFVLCLVIFGMWLAAEMSWLHLTGLVLTALPAGLIAFVLEPYRIKRVIAFFVKDKEAIMSFAYQTHQSMIAVGSGGLFGLGLGESKQKFHFLTEAHNDFIFAILCEELGFIRVSVILALFAILIMLGWRVAMRTSDLFGSLLASGVTLMLFIPASIHMAVTLGMVPPKGLVLPFISAGGSSLIVCMSAMGLLMNVASTEYTRQTSGSLR